MATRMIGYKVRHGWQLVFTEPDESDVYDIEECTCTTLALTAREADAAFAEIRDSKMAELYWSAKGLAYGFVDPDTGYRCSYARYFAEVVEAYQEGYSQHDGNTVRRVVYDGDFEEVV